MTQPDPGGPTIRDALRMTLRHVRAGGALPRGCARATPDFVSLPCGCAVGLFAGSASVCSPEHLGEFLADEHMELVRLADGCAEACCDPA